MPNPATAAEPLLSGITVLDFTRVLAGPYSTRLLADLGADVIKIERPGEGDEVRYVGQQLQEGSTDQSAYFSRINAGKRGVGIDLANPASREVILDLLAKADIVVENFAPGVMTKYQLDYASLSAIKPGIVYCSISGFGQKGPLSSMQAYAHLINAFSGMMELERGGIFEPRASNLQAADVLAGAHAFGAICAAMIRKLRTGQGAYVDVSMLECMIAADDVNYGAILNGGSVDRRPRRGMVVHKIGERYVATQLGSGAAMWPRLLKLMNRPELADDPRFQTPGDRRVHWDALEEIIREWLSGYASVEEAVAAISAARMPAAPVTLAEEMIDHPHLAQRQFFQDVPHGAGGKARITAQPFHLDGGPVKPTGPAPWRIGEHTREVLGEVLGYSAERIAGLHDKGAIAFGS
ncbi:CaiB/BaiF CoA transferase family protein [Quisquiliibacterium transsilvanicum]|uniref:Crotonobetainyl-CoA:carnitine CoA-transferase CaiB-like acyl-CoA transferase n=1 Tax=Quisquiliibacterium transsilvanicum TaxID=1549638 RepID=A0A7W8HJP5_9BURK|nr:CoA transferase [Quisquiliibacterium transsilvanicum]MBB5273317.1 crotonobetainyl-CoA:carnitine CoA-transferase CaiB-like acyl-CoA transferase [Quisquiliibacterium transsilvanicum]